MRHLRFVRLVCATVLAGVACAALAAPTANAGLLGCGATTKAFARFGDGSNYFLVSNGNFESGSAGWTLSGGAAVVSGNEPYDASGPGSHSLALPSGSSALGPRTCVNLLTPHARMFVRGPSEGASRLDVQVIFYGLLGNALGSLRFDSMSSADFTEWGPSDKVSSALALPLFTSYCRVKLSVSGTGDAWLVDDLFGDPWISGMG